MTKVEGSDNIPSNDEIVDDLLQDFQKSCKTEGRTTDLDDGNDVGKSSDEDGAPGSSKPVEVDELIEEKPDTKRPDFIDEEEMKQKELSYTQQDIEVC